MMRLVVLFALAAALTVAAAFGGRLHIVRQQSDASTDAAREAARWRATGPDGLNRVLQLQPSDALAANPSPEALAWRSLVDAVAGQREAWASRLYWYTSLDDAKEAAEKTGKPILSLRLLGRLTDEHSCANSRYFRKTLYPNAAVGKFLRENFVLHWESVRPVPTVTIDFGDGRTLKRTITGNSVHYVLDYRGRLVDALPGLYAPQQFLAALKPVYELALVVGSRDELFQRMDLSSYHERRIAEIEANLRTDLQRLGAPVDKAENWHALLYTATLSAGDESTLRQLPSERLLTRRMRSTMPIPDRDLRIWELLAQLHQEDVQQDADAMRVIAPGARPVQRANRLAFPKTKTEERLLANVHLDEFSANRALDFVYNEYALRYKIHWELRNGETRNRPLADFTRWCYAEVFLSPLDDPWYGLKSDAYDGYDASPAPQQTAQANR